MTPDEEQLVWESYLAKYPKSLFRDRIEEHMEELSAIMFGERVPGSDKGSAGVDAVDRELNFAQPFSLSSVDTRSHVSVGVQWGFPRGSAARWTPSTRSCASSAPTCSSAATSRAVWCSPARSTPSSRAPARARS